MITNLFSVFDPSSSIIRTPMNWTSSLIGIVILPTIFWVIPSRWGIIWSSVTKILPKEFKTLLGSSSVTGRTLLFVSLFGIIAFINFIWLFPYIFTNSRHIVFTLTLALPIWLRYIVYGWLNHTTHILAHLVPQGTPGILKPFMVCIEIIRNIIQPGTLAVRLAANMIAGHLLLTLLGNNGPSSSYTMITLLLLIQVAPLILESAVSIIQSYVFAVLSTLYSREVK